MVLAVVVPSALLTVFYCKLARGTPGSLRWTIVSCLLISLLAAASHFQVTFSDLPGKNTLMFGLGLGRMTLQVNPLIRASIPLLLGFWLWRRAHGTHDATRVVGTVA